MERKQVNKKFFIVLGIALAVLLGALWLNISFNREKAEAEAASDRDLTPDSVETAAQVYGDYFVSFREQRSVLRAQEIDYLRSIINSENSDAEALSDAQGRLMQLVSNMEKEFSIESRIRSKGFLDAAATLRDDTATIVINGEALSDEEVARILDIVISETGLPASKIKISLGT